MYPDLRYNSRRRRRSGVTHLCTSIHTYTLTDRVCAHARTFNCTASPRRRRVPPIELNESKMIAAVLVRVCVCCCGRCVTMLTHSKPCCAITYTVCRVSLKTRTARPQRRRRRRRSRNSARRRAAAVAVVGLSALSVTQTSARVRHPASAALARSFRSVVVQVSSRAHLTCDRSSVRRRPYRRYTSSRFGTSA